MVRAFLLALVTVLLPLGMRATHIIGGELFYTSVGNDDYEVTLKIYRDCGPNNTNGTGFDATVEIGVFDAGGGYLFSEFFNFPGSSNVPVLLNNPCLTPPSSICVEEAQYTGLVQLPAGTGGYILSYQRCCRTPTILNLNTPGNQGLTCTVEVPDANITGANSSPRFTTYPPIALCANQPMSFDHSATDPDGDLLVYELAEPLNGGNNINPMPSPPAPPPYPPVTWGAGFSLANMISASPALTVNSVTGLGQLTPTLIGSFVVGVRVKEFRNGQQLSQVMRDFRFDVVNCQVTVISSIQQQSTFCSGLTLTMGNQSTGNFFHWDFGVGGTNADTSALAAPTFTYPDTGSYTVTLIANPGWPCADTSTAQVSVFPPLTVSYVPPPITCAGAQPITLVATGNFTGAANFTWDPGAQGSAPSVSNASIQPTFSPGTHVVSIDVTDFGCSGSYTDTIVVFPDPTVSFSSDTMGCAPLDVVFSNGSTAWTTLQYAWDFGDGATSATELPAHTYAVAGLYDVSLTVMTDSGCVDTLTMVLPGQVRVWPQPVAQLYAEPEEVSVLDPVVTIHDASLDADAWAFTLDGSVYDVPVFTHTFSDAGQYTVELVVSSGLGCLDTARINVFVKDHLFYAPNVFTPNGDDLNEVWLPSVLGARLYDLSVFDRWGREVFHTDDPKKGWDGQGYPQGTYVFKARLSEYGALDLEYVGSVTLAR
jgi:gliding motility-associated-like protein